MKKILITGANSYIGMSVDAYLKQWPDQYAVDTVDMIDGSWREKDFSAYDTVFHVAGIAHQKETAENSEMYYKVNRDLALDTAKKAREDGVKQFIFLSSMSVYGVDSGIITRDTLPAPRTNYGKSKLQAEEAMRALRCNGFRLAVLRPPMVYGKGCKGNFQLLLKLVTKLPVFPKVNNRRSMLYIENLCSFVKLCVDDGLDGVFFPQNREYVSTLSIAKVIACKIEKKRWFSALFGLAVVICRPFVKTLNKAFGSLVYQDTEDFGFAYCVVDNDESMKRSI